MSLSDGMLEQMPLSVKECPRLPRRGFGEMWEPLVGSGPGARGSVVLEGLQRDLPAQKLVARLKKGRSVSPKVEGKWAKMEFEEMLKRALRADDAYWMQRVINGLIVKAAKGNPGAQRIVWERAAGAVKEHVELSGSVQFQKQVVLTDLREIPALPIECEVLGEPERT